jgi:ABC-type transport system involved in multi-copper enzyme maturation permease subunit
MLTLIKREIEDAIVFFALAFAFVLPTIAALIYPRPPHPFGIPEIMYKILGFFVFMPLVAAAMGAVQMRADKEKKISSFLTTLAATRGQIFAARIITGLIWILLLYVPLAVTDIVLLKVFPPAVVTDGGFLARIIITLFVCTLAGYSFGLQIGWSSNKLIPVLGIIFVVPVIASAAIIKGAGFQTNALLLAFAAAAIIRTSQKFFSTAL